MNATRRYGRPASDKRQGVNPFGLLLVLCAPVCIYSTWQIYTVFVHRQEDWKTVQNWLKRYEIADHENVLYNAGIRNMNDVADFELPLDKYGDFKSLSPSNVARVERAIRLYQDEVLLNQWLVDHSFEKYSNRLSAEGIRSLEALALTSEPSVVKLLGPEASLYDKKMFAKAVNSLRALAPNFSQYKSDEKFGYLVGSIIGGVLCAAFLAIVYCYGAISTSFAPFQLAVGSKSKFLDFVTGQCFAAGKTAVQWMWKDGEVVGQTFQFTVKFYKRNGQPYVLSSEGSVTVEITQRSLSICPTVQHLEEERNGVRVKFSIVKSGMYKISVFFAGKHINGSPFVKNFISGPMDPGKSQFINQGSIVVGCRGKTLTLLLEPHDSYENPCDFVLNKTLLNKFHMLMTETSSHIVSEPAFQCQYLASAQKLTLSLTIETPGCYHTLITCDKQQMKNSEFHTIILSESELAGVEKTVAKKCHTVSFEARLLSTDYTSPSDRGKKVHCYISPRQFTIKEFHLRIIPKKLFAFRVCPSTKFQFLGVHNQLDMPVLSIDDGSEKPVLIASKDRNIIAATFSKLLMKNIGGSETFTDKRDFFYHEIRQLHAKRIHYRLPIKINREKLLESSVKATKHFSTSDWCKNFEITFTQEEGLDWGGLKREWFEVLSTEMFDPTKSGMFIRFNDDPQALSHPNHQLPPGIKLKYFEFAGKIVGKCLYESALGGAYRLQVKARFTRSFLAQLIGLRVNYKYFEKDDPDLYTQKICYIENNDVDDLELTFSEEEFQAGKLVKVVELIQNGSKIPVTNSNKKKYLDLLAQYRLSTRVRDQIEAFLKGLGELIPDNLLSIFDENELELLICGTGEYSIEDFKKHHTVCGSSPLFLQAVEWFWDIVSSYSQEEMARLLQFITGSSQLPPGGFSELVPQIQLSSAQTYNVLPTAHTCFNQLCLPSYDSFNQMRQALYIAITEGNQGFGMI